VAVAPSAAWAGASDQGLSLSAWQFGLPVLVGVKLDRGRELVVAPQLQDELIAGSEGSAGGSLNVLAGGFSVGLVAPVGRWVVAPGAGLLFPAYFSAHRSDAEAGSTLYLGRWSVQAGCSVLFGGI
jgi:hypothetical protein